MALRFSGTYEQLKKKLEALAEEGQWRDVNDNQKQFQHQNGGILNWYPTTGSIHFQGKAEGPKELEERVTKILSSTVTTDKITPTQIEQKLPVSTLKNHQASQATDSPRNQESTVVAAPTAEQIPTSVKKNPLGQIFSESELVLGLVGAVGTELKKAIDILADRLGVFGYTVSHIRVSDEIITIIDEPQAPKPKDEFERISAMMNAGDAARKKSGDNAILALGIAAKIAASRPNKQFSPEHAPRRVYIVNSLKHPEEVERLREIYPQGFYLLGVHSDQIRRHHYLVQDKRLTAKQANELMDRDEDEHLEYGQRTSDTFHMSDFFVRLDGNEDRLKDSIWRILDILFGDPYRTPTFDEFAMFMAFSASLRSADLSRQVGAVVARDDEILATGANDCPRFGGGLYWPEYDEDKGKIADKPDGRDYMRGQDSNKVEQSRIIEDILRKVDDVVTDKQKFREALQKTRISDLTEFGRVVHAEMEALLSCARNSISARGATVYCTTFPCHNCAKHIVATGIQRVVYVEPYPKSKAAEFHTDSISLGFTDSDNTVRFEPFVGVGPRRFFDLFSMRLGSGYRLKRKDQNGQNQQWKQESAKLRIQMLPFSYLDLETVASTKFNQYRQKHGERS